MAGQATMKNGATGSINEVIGGIGEMGNHVVNLAALQVELARLDLRQSRSRFIPAILALAVCSPIAIASVTLLLIAASYGLHAYYQLSVATSVGLVTSAGLGISVMLASIAYREFRAGLASFRRSSEEFERNLAWLGTVIKQSGR